MALIWSLSACTTPNPRLCKNSGCADPAYPFCDVDGSLSGTPGFCIAVECTPQEFEACRGDVSIVCNEFGNDYDLVECEFGCDDSLGGCRGVDPTFPRVRLRAKVATTTAQLLPDPTFGSAPIAPSPSVRVGAIGGPLMDATYEPDGKVAYPADLELGPKWRFEYTLDQEPPREVQWKPAEARGDIIVPLFGRHDRLPVPQNSGYRLAPSGGPDPAPALRLYTFGIWTDAVLGPAAMPYDFNFFNAVSMSGAKGAPEPAKGDAAMLADYEPQALPTRPCTLVKGMAFFQAPLVANTFSQTVPVAPAWQKLRSASAVIDYDGIPQEAQATLDTALGSRAGTLGPDKLEYGRIPSLAMPGFSRRSVGFQLPIPLIVPFATCEYGLTTTPNFVEPGELSGLPRAVHAQLINSRTPPSSPTLYSGLQALVVSDGNFQLTFDVALAVAPILLYGPNALDLSGPVDGNEIDASGPLTLSFALGTQSSFVANYFDVTLIRIPDSSTLVRERTYTVTEPSVAIDPAVLVKGALYVLEIRSHRGYPDVALGDFSKIEGPLATGTIYTRTFRVKS